MKALLCLVICVALVSAQERAAQEVCSAAVAALPDVDVFFSGTATTEDYDALDAVCEGTCFAELNTDIKSWIVENNPSLCGVDSDALAQVIGGLTAFLCLQDPDVPDVYCVDTLAAGLEALGVDITADPITVTGITAEEACFAAASTGCCYSSYMEVLENLFLLSGLTNLQTYSEQFRALCGTPLLADGDENAIPGACDGFDTADIDTNDMTPSEVDCNAAEADCATQACGLLYCMDDIANFGTSISNAEVQSLVQAIAEELKRAAATSEQCTLEGYGTQYWDVESDGDGTGEDCTGEAICNSSAERVGVSILAAASIVVLFLRFW